MGHSRFYKICHAGWIMLLSAALGHFAARPLPAAPVTATALALTSQNDDRTLSATSSYTIDLTQTACVDNRRLILENTGTTDIVNPWVVINDKRDWMSIDTMAREIAGGETDPEKLAFRVWRFLRENRYHWDSAETGLEIHDPVKYLNIYGYGLCDDSASVAEALFLKLGFAQARTWWLSGHVIPEVFYNDGWHIFDPDLEVFYPTLDGQGVAGYEDLLQNSWLIQRISGAEIWQIYLTTSDNSIITGNWETSHTMAMTLRPGERFKRCWFNWGPYHCIDMKPAPPVYGNGSLSYRPDLASPALARGMEQLTGFTQETDGITTPTLHPAAGGTTATLVCAMTCPYIFVDGYVSLDAAAAGAGETILGEFSRDGVNWSTLGTIQGPYQDTAIWELDHFIAPLGTEALYKFWIRLTVTGTQPRAVGISNLTIQGVIQCAPSALPALEPGTVNNVSVSFTSAPGASLNVHHDYNVQFTDTPTTPIQTLTPAPAAYLPAAGVSFSWLSVGSDAQSYEVLVTRDPQGLMPVSPLMWPALSGTQTTWAAPDGWLLNGHRYYWQVRYKDLLGQWRPWSAAVPFDIGEKNAAGDWRKYF